MSTEQPPSFDEIRSEYWQLFQECEVKPEHLKEVKSMVSLMIINRQRYQRMTSMLGGMPWWFMGLVHAMERGFSFNRHLHNGDPLNARNVNSALGRPSARTTATWEESAVDAMRWRGLHTWTDWSISGALYKLEEYNGWGYRIYHPEVLSPYLWSWTNKYTQGKYAEDGLWDGTLISDQPGAAALLRLMVNTGLVLVTDETGDSTPSPTIVNVK